MKNSTLEKILNNTKVLLEDFDDSENHENLQSRDTTSPSIQILKLFKNKN